MRMFGKNIKDGEDEYSLDSVDDSSVVFSYTNQKTDFALSTIKDKAGNDKADKAQRDKALDERGTIMCDDFWYDFLLLAKVCLLRDKDADLFDVFETIRTKFLGGWGFTQTYIDKLDAEIEAEYQKECLKGLMTKPSSMLSPAKSKAI